ncbi:hypothetical protein PanWU01x14_255430 [Parasponia andersonii]|uniref:Calmodulin-binding protein n=1 Tax=Parasponia andersonii TaxID=3476 RepID=A0A2P5BAS5_PARAD|nr:hypothetical protein PanWU01x14_255430 [Parasponia andersonii]
MEVVIPTQGLDFDFNNSLSAMTSPYSTAPSSPKRFGEYYFSAPTSPSRLSSFYRDFNELSTANGDVYGSQSPPKVPFNWEENPGTPKNRRVQDDDGRDHDDFAFDFSVDLERTSLSADELFDGGKIRPLKPPPRLQLIEISNQGSSSAIRKNSSPDSRSSKKTVNERGRERNTTTMLLSTSTNGALSSSKSGRRATRSQSPLRVSQYPWEEEDQVRQPRNKNDNKQDSALVSKASISSTTTTTTTTTPSSNPSKSSSRKWRLRDFLLFRSASEGRASEKDPLRRYYMKKHEDVKNASFRSTDSFGGSARRKGPVSAHELHYTVNKAVSEDLKKKTFLPYKQGILGRLAFNPAVHALANGFGSLTRA